MKPFDILLPYQKKWMSDNSKLKIAEKSRRVGLSWTEAAYSVTEAAIQNGRNTYYMSYNKAMTKQFVQDCAFWAKLFGKICSEIKEIVIKNEDRDITMYRTVFDSGCEIVGMPSDAYNLRAKQGRVILDEAAFCADMDGVLKAAKALLIWGGQLIVISTHNGEDNPFNLLIKDIANGRAKKWSHLRITFDEAIEQGLYKKICQKQKEKWNKEKETGFVAEIREIYKDNIDEELNCIPCQSGARYFSRGLLDYATADGVHIARLSCKDSFLRESESRKAAEIKSFFTHDVAPILRSCESRVFIGRDIGRSGDLSLYWVCQQTGKTTLQTMMIIELKNIPYEMQQQLDDLVTDELDDRRVFGGMATDSRGIGHQLAEHSTLRHPGAAIEAMETPAWYAQNGSALYGMLESAEFTIPDDEVIKGDFSVVTLKNGSPHIAALRTGDRVGNSKRHGDAAAAAMLCVYAFKECATDAPPFFSACEKTDPWSIRTTR